MTCVGEHANLVAITGVFMCGMDPAVAMECLEGACPHHVSTSCHGFKVQGQGVGLGVRGWAVESQNEPPHQRAREAARTVAAAGVGRRDPRYTEDLINLRVCKRFFFCPSAPKPNHQSW